VEFISKVQIGASYGNQRATEGRELEAGRAAFSIIHLLSGVVIIILQPR
jgi:hypothetical protein